MMPGIYNEEYEDLLFELIKGRDKENERR